MKIGIVTFFCVPNYGAMLQAYSLWKFLEEHGHSVEFIDYAFVNTRRIPIWKCFLTRNMSNWKSVIKKKLNLYAQFEIVKFSDSFPRTKYISTYTDLLKLGNKYDAIIVGSDQMWNPVWCSGVYLPIVMLDFAAEGVKRISFAVSFATKEWRREQNAEMARRLLEKFDAISVREESGISLVHSLSGRNDAERLIDPTLLHTASFYTSLFKVQGKKSGQPYIFSYFLDEWLNNENVESILNIVLKVTRLRYICSDKKPVDGMMSLICKIFDVKAKISVITWLEKIANADFVITNSFHGTVFAILFHKPFLTMFVSGKMQGMNERIISLLNMLNLKSRAINFEDIANCQKIIECDIDWESVDKILDVERMRGRDFIKSELV